MNIQGRNEFVPCDPELAARGASWKGEEDVETDYSGIKNVRNNDFSLGELNFLAANLWFDYESSENLAQTKYSWLNTHHTHTQLENPKKDVQVLDAS